MGLETQMKSVSPAILVEDDFESVRHFRLMPAITSIAGRTRDTGTAAMAGILARAVIAPRLVDVILTDPSRSAAH